MTPTHANAQLGGRLSLGRKAGYGTVELGISAIEFFVQIYLLKFYTDTVGLSPSLAGLALALAVIWDAITDPIMGTVSDHTRFRAGKRVPYVVLGAPLLAASFLLLFSPPQMATELERFAFLLVGYILVNSGMTLMAIPHAALAGELSNDLDERVELFGWRFVFANLGLLLGIVIPGIVVYMAGENTAGAVSEHSGTASRYVAVVVIASAVVTALACVRFDRPSTEPPMSLATYLRGLLSVISNRPFLILVAAYIIGSVGRALNSAVALFYYQYRLMLPDTEVLFYVLLPFVCLISLSVVLWLRLASRYGKKLPAVFGIAALGVMTAVVYPILPAGQLWPPIAVAIVGGVLVGAIFLLDSAVTDIVDYDEVRTGAHREGLYFGFWRMGTKLARAVGLALAGFLLDFVGFDPDASSQSAEAIGGIALIFGPGVGVCFVIGAAVYGWMPLDRATSRRIRRILDQRQQNRQRRLAAQAHSEAAGSEQRAKGTGEISGLD